MGRQQLYELGVPGHDVVWGLSYVYVTTDPFTNTNFTSTPPPNPDVIIWQLFEDGGDRYAAIGKVDSVPEPGITATLAAGVAALSGLAVPRHGKPRKVKESRGKPGRRAILIHDPESGPAQPLAPIKAIALRPHREAELRASRS